MPVNLFSKLNSIEFTHYYTPKVYFVLSRVIGLGTKALFLWFLVNKGYQKDSYMISLYFVVLGSSMIIYNNEAYYEFYKHLFDENTSNFKVLRSRAYYFENIFYHILLFTPLVLASIFLITKRMEISITFLVFIILEKVLDEIQRYLLFSKKFVSWGNNLMIYSMLPPFVSVFFLSFNINYISEVYFIVLVVVLFSLIYSKLPSYFKKKIFVEILGLNLKSCRTYFETYRKKYVYNQIFSYLSGNVLLFDKWLILAIGSGRSSLASFYFLSQVANIINLIVDYFFISTRRTFFLKKNLTFSQVIDRKSVV